MEPHPPEPADASRGPLAGLGIVVTRPARQAAAFAQKLAALGASPIVFPAIVILPPADRAALDDVHAAVARLRFRGVRIGERRRIRRARRTTLASVAGCVRAGSGDGGSARWRRHSRRSRSAHDARQRRCARVAGAGRCTWPAHRRLPRRRRPRAARGHASQARRARRSRVVLPARRDRPAVLADSSKRCASAARMRSRSRRAKASTTCGRCSATKVARLMTRLPVFAPHPRIAERARAHRPAHDRDRGRRRGADRRIARMGRSASGTAQRRRLLIPDP